MIKSAELTIYHCARPKTVAELLEVILRAFPDVPLENLEPSFGIVSLTIKVKE